jgi:hypothetical protein
MRTTHITTLAVAGVFAALTGCTPVHQLKITNTSQVPMELHQEISGDSTATVQRRLEPGESLQVNIQQGEEIVLTDALTIQILGD